MLIILAVLFSFVFTSRATSSCSDSVADFPDDETTQLLQTRLQAEDESPPQGGILAILGAAASVPQVNGSSANATNKSNSSGANESSAVLHDALPSSSGTLKKEVTSTILYSSALLILMLGVGAYFAPMFHAHDGGFTMGQPAVEFLGTFMFVFSVFCCKHLAGDWSAAVVGFVYMAIAYATDSESGGQLNPAITLCRYFARRAKFADTVKYCLAQVLASILACFFCCLLWTPKAASLAPVAPFCWWHAGIAETVYTGLVCLAFLACSPGSTAVHLTPIRQTPLSAPREFRQATAEQEKPSHAADYCGLAAGFILIAGGYAAEKISGAHFNPGLSIGMEMVTSSSTGHGFEKACFQVLGACWAAMVFRILQLDNFEVASSSLPVRCACEALGVFTFVVTVYLTAITQTSMILVAFAMAAAIAGMVYSIGSFCGGHFNPVVTIALCLADREKIQPLNGCIYILVQVVAAIWAGVLCSVFKMASSSLIAPTFWLADCNCPSKLLSYGTMELLFTFALAYAALGTNADGKMSHRQGITFAVCTAAVYMAGSIASGKISAGGRMNPTLAIAALSAGFIEAAAKDSNFQDLTSTLLPNLPICWFVQLLGSLLAAYAYHVTHRSDSILSQFISEFIGTYVFAFTSGVCLRLGEGGWSYMAVAAIAFAMTCTAHHMSGGGHLNPAVSLTLAISKKIDLRRMVCDWLAQMSASLVAMAGVYGIFNQIPAVGPAYPFQWGHAAVSESIYTFLLCFVVSHCHPGNLDSVLHRAPAIIYAAAYTFAIAAGGIAVGGISSGTVFNPAFGLAINVVELKVGWSYALCFFQALGALLAAVSLRLFSSSAVASYSVEVKCFSEFIGVFMLVLTLGIGTTASSIGVAFSAAAILMCMNCCLGEVSGGHFNPAVTLAAVLCDPLKFPIQVALQYMVTQLIAGAFAGHAYAAFHAAGPNSDKTFGLEPGTNFSFEIAGATEFFFTIAFVYVVLASTTNLHGGNTLSFKNHFTGLFGASIYAAGLAGIHGVSGGMLNPAVCFGIAFANLSHSGSTSPSINFLPFAAWELAGGFIATIVFYHSHQSRQRQKTLKELGGVT